MLAPYIINGLRHTEDSSPVGVPSFPLFAPPAPLPHVTFCQLPLAPLLRVAYYPKWRPRKANTGFSRRSKTPTPTGRLTYKQCHARKSVTFEQRGKILISEVTCDFVLHLIRAYRNQYLSLLVRPRWTILVFDQLELSKRKLNSN